MAQALHWFDLPRFWAEATRVLKPGGVLAAWGYNWPVVAPAVDRTLEDLQAELASSWPPRSTLLHGEYRSITAPLPEIAAPAFQAHASWDLEDYLAHLRSWSATRYYRERTGRDIVTQFQLAFASAWPGGRVPATWPLILRVFRNSAMDTHAPSSP